MAEEAIPERVKAFVAGQIDSVLQLEVLLLLHSRADQTFTADDVARELRIDPAWAGPRLEELQARGVVAGSQCGYQYGPRSPELHDTIAALARAYSTHRVTITALIFSNPPSSLRSFADAFRLRKDPSDG